MAEQRVNILVYKSDGTLIAQYLLGDGEHLIGRDINCPVYLDSEYISTNHAKLHLGADGIYIEDLNSTSGTFLDGVTVRGKLRIKPGQVLQVGDLTIDLQPESTENIGPGSRLADGRYTLIRLLGRGGMGEARIDAGHGQGAARGVRGGLGGHRHPPFGPTCIGRAARGRGRAGRRDDAGAGSGRPAPAGKPIQVAAPLREGSRQGGAAGGINPLQALQMFAGAGGFPLGGFLGGGAPPVAGVAPPSPTAAAAAVEPGGAGEGGFEAAAAPADGRRCDGRLGAVAGRRDGDDRSGPAGGARVLARTLRGLGDRARRPGRDPGDGRGDRRTGRGGPAAHGSRAGRRDAGRPGLRRRRRRGTRGQSWT